MEDRLQHNILYICATEPTKGHTPFINDHSISYVTSGEIEVFAENGTMTYGKGSLGLIKRNQLLKAVKKPIGHEPFMSINIILTQEFLKKYSVEHNIKSTGVYLGEPNVLLPVDPFMKGYLDSLMPYFENPQHLSETLAFVKTIEAIELLMRNTAFTNLLFDFSEPYKIDLEAYMNRYFTYNVPINQFAQLTGRSVSTFKRDFSKTFDASPEKWILKKRLDLAFHLLKQRQCRPSDVYLEVGFENFSHFSTSFKKEFGISPTILKK
jgi:AraC-like DNA-binding protein